MSELSRLRWLCRRGMKELDVVMTQYLEVRYEGASEVEKKSFKHLLDMQDPDLYALLLGQNVCPDNDIQNLIVALRSLNSRR
ncbi:MAG: antitoxin CptB [Candidatus Azotimanducaceae bacterium]|jgi:antitoxin CptB